MAGDGRDPPDAGGQRRFGDLGSVHVGLSRGRFLPFTPLAFAHFLKGFTVIRFDTPLWVFSVFAMVLVEMLKRMRLGFLERGIREGAWRLDRLLQPKRPKPRSFAGAYLIVARKGTPG